MVGRLQCDICGGKIAVLAGGQRGECEVCGAGYDIERLRELASGAGATVVQKEDPERRFFEIEYGTLVKYHGVSKVVRIPDDVVRIGDSAFCANSIIEDVIISTNVKVIENRAFYACGSLTSVTIPDGVTEIGAGAFEDCIRLTSVTFHGSVIVIESGAFQGCSSLSSVNIPDGVTRIKSMAFSNCGALTTVNIPNSVVAIERGAFQGCSSLVSVSIPESVLEIAAYAFAHCVSLAAVNIANPMCKVAEAALIDTFIENRREEEVERRREQKRIWRERGLCQHCGGTFKGFLPSNTICSQCGKPKYY